MNNSPRAKSVALIFLVGAFLAGSALGYAADRTFSKDTNKVVLPVNQQAMRDSLQALLRLSSQQRLSFDSAYDARRVRLRVLEAQVRPAFDSIYERMRPAMDSVCERIRPARDSIFELTHQRVALVLDPSQKKTYMDLVDSSKAKGGPPCRMPGGDTKR
ncbi:MAG: hypothetical protein ABJC26_04645 [Gemmatimonadaceae bacterium]